ncbi:MAG: hypothetical protein ACFB5Z_11060 [Elainellaceae cyanobacterium]
MQSTHAEVQRIQARLQVLGHRRQTRHSPSKAAEPGLRSAAPAPLTGTSGGEVRLPRAATQPPRSPQRASTASLQQPAAQIKAVTTKPTVEPYRVAEVAYRRAAPPADSASSTTASSPITSPPASPADAAQLANALRYRQYPSGAISSGPVSRSPVSRSPVSRSPVAHSPIPKRAADAGLQTGSDYLLRWVKRLGRSLRYSLTHRPPAPSNAASDAAFPYETPHNPPYDAPAAGLNDLTLQDILLWVAASAAVRVGLDLLLATYAGLWLPVIALIIAPAAIALYQTAVNPKAGFVLGGRLLLIMIGLLLGGRF